MTYATVTQRLSDFFPKNIPKEEQVYRNYTLPQQFWPYYTDPSYGTIRYNTYVGNIVSTETYDVRVKGGYFNYIDSLDRVYNEDGTYRYNVVIGYNQLTSVNGNSNIYIGRNSSSFSLNTNNTISLGQDVVPENDYIILRPNASKGTIKILPSKSSNQIYFCDYYGDNNILHDTFNETVRNSIYSINQFKNFIENSSFVVKTSYFGLTSSNIVFDDSSLYSKNSDFKISSTNLNLSSSNITLTGNNIFSRTLNANINDSNFRISSTNQNISSCNITLTGNNIYSRTLSAHLTDNFLRLASTTWNVSSSDITLTGNDIYSRTLSAHLTDNFLRFDSTNQNISSCNITLTGNDIYSRTLSAHLTDNFFRLASTTWNVSSSDITLTGNDIYSRTLSAHLTDDTFRIATSNFNISSCDIYADNSTITINDSEILVKENSRLKIDNSRISTTNQTYSLGYSALSDRNGMYSYAFGGFSENGDSQKSNFEFRGNTTTNSFVEFDVMVIPTDKFWSGIINVLGIRTNGEDCARYMRQVTIGNVGGNTSIYGSITTIGTDRNAIKSTSNTELQVIANDTNNSLRIRIRGLPSENMRWMAFAEGIELKF